VAFGCFLGPRAKPMRRRELIELIVSAAVAWPFAGFNL
jgi:hypothetical protein